MKSETETFRMLLQIEFVFIRTGRNEHRRNHFEAAKATSEEQISHFRNHNFVSALEKRF